ELQNHPEYLEVNELYGVYSEINQAIKDPESLSDEELLYITSRYSLLYETVDYTDSLIDDINYSILDELPEMPGLFTDILDTMVSSLAERDIVKMPPDSADFVKEIIIEEYISSIPNIDFNKLYMVRDINRPNLYIIISESGDLYLRIWYYPEANHSISLTPVFEYNTGKYSELVPFAPTLLEKDKDIFSADIQKIG
ncbi:MAG: hypothetical protein IKU52_00480, partial [Clostridia bacterium]|nr:hypothetical protein [Clostridia bacterium]